ncbi:MAG: hypothetical protein ACREE8_07445 [Hypericibacter sp.]
MSLGMARPFILTLGAGNSALTVSASAAVFLNPAGLDDIAVPAFDRGRSACRAILAVVGR